MSYIQLSLELSPFYPANEILVAKLNEIDFESYAEKDPILFAYIEKSKFSETELNELLKEFKTRFKVDYQIKEIQKENWNKKWEESFQAIEIVDFCRIRAPFHDKKEGFKYEIIIEPKMSFGTGHHETTQLMITFMKDFVFKDKTVLDMGSGTGILAILAEKLGAKSIDAIDNEEWAFINIQENILKNECKRIEPYLGGKEQLESKVNYDFILANINKNVLKDQFATYSNLQKKGQKLLISGFFETDVEELRKSLLEIGYIFDSLLKNNSWSSVLFVKG